MQRVLTMIAVLVAVGAASSAHAAHPCRAVGGGVGICYGNATQAPPGTGKRVTATGSAYPCNPRLQKCGDRIPTARVGASPAPVASPPRTAAYHAISEKGTGGTKGPNPTKDPPGGDGHSQQPGPNCPRQPCK